MSRPIPYKQLAAAIEKHASHLIYEVPGAPTITIVLQAERLGGQWAILRHGFDDRTVWNGTDWVTAGSAEEMFRWTVVEALRLVDDLASAEAAAHAAWKAQRTPAAEVEEFLAEFASEQEAAA